MHNATIDLLIERLQRIADYVGAIDYIDSIGPVLTQIDEIFALFPVGRFTQGNVVITLIKHRKSHNELALFEKEFQSCNNQEDFWQCVKNFSHIIEHAEFNNTELFLLGFDVSSELYCVTPNREIRAIK